MCSAASQAAILCAAGSNQIRRRGAGAAQSIAAAVFQSQLSLFHFRHARPLRRFRPAARTVPQHLEALPPQRARQRSLLSPPSHCTRRRDSRPPTTGIPPCPRPLRIHKPKFRCAARQRPSRRRKDRRLLHLRHALGRSLAHPPAAAPRVRSGLRFPAPILRWQRLRASSLRRARPRIARPSLPRGPKRLRKREATGFLNFCTLKCPSAALRIRTRR